MFFKIEKRVLISNIVFINYLLLFSNAICFSNWLCIISISKPKIIAVKIKAVFNKPLTEKDNLIKIVDIIKPEFLMTLWKSTVWKKENNNKTTSAIIKIAKNCSKKILLIFLNETSESELSSTELISQFINE